MGIRISPGGYILTQDIVIPAGTILSQAAKEHGGRAAIEVAVGLGKDSHAWLIVPLLCIPDAPAGMIKERAQ